MKKLLAVLVSMVSTTLFVAQAFCQDGTWVTKAPMPTARYGPAAGVINDKLYVVGGWLLATDNGHAPFEVYDPATDTWDTTKAPIPLAVQNPASGVIDGKLYVAGGGHHGNVASLQVYDPFTDTWTLRASMPFASGHASSGVIDGKLYLVGGTDPSNTALIDTLRVYDPATDTWEIKAPLSGVRAGMGAGVIGGKLYVVGGSNWGASNLDTVEVYDPATNSWSGLAPLPTSRMLLGVVVVDDILYALGGMHINNINSTEVEAYNPATNAWTSQDSMPTGHSSGAYGAINNVIYAIGGWDPVVTNGTANDAFVVTTPAANEPPVFSPIGSQTVNEGETLSFVVVASDPDGDEVSYAVGTLPAGASFNATTQTFSWTPDYNQAGNYSITFYATDNGVPNETSQMPVSISVSVPPPTVVVTQIINTITSIYLPKSMGNAYMANLGKVNTFIGENKLTPAIQQLNAFIGKVTSDIQKGKISQAVGNYLITAANAAIAILNAP